MSPTICIRVPSSRSPSSLAGKWTIPGSITWRTAVSYTWAISTDTIQVNGAFNMTDGSSTISFELDSRTGAATGRLFVTGALVLSGTIQSRLINFDTTVNPSTGLAYANAEFLRWDTLNRQNALMLTPSIAAPYAPSPLCFLLPPLPDRPLSYDADWQFSGTTSNIDLAKSTTKQMQLKRKATTPSGNNSSAATTTACLALLFLALLF